MNEFIIGVKWYHMLDVPSAWKPPDSVLMKRKTFSCYDVITGMLCENGVVWKVTVCVITHVYIIVIIIIIIIIIIITVIIIIIVIFLFIFICLFQMKYIAHPTQQFKS